MTRRIQRRNCWRRKQASLLNTRPSSIGKLELEWVLRQGCRGVWLGWSGKVNYDGVGIGSSDLLLGEQSNSDRGCEVAARIGVWNQQIIAVYNILHFYVHIVCAA